MCWCGPALLDTSKERKCYLNVQVGWFDDSREEDWVPVFELGHLQKPLSPVNYPCEEMTVESHESVLSVNDVLKSSVLQSRDCEFACLRSKRRD